MPQDALRKTSSEYEAVRNHPVNGTISTEGSRTQPQTLSSTTSQIMVLWCMLWDIMVNPYEWGCRYWVRDGAAWVVFFHDVVV
ncbi:hypothetical protein RRG08_054469 [Elysia crispata]|uniref:Uncharacterized protein n=1 Tax=Elysia crispata TaxID=231223 RepID=A0AAE0Y7Y7_9GAST|nr:hypothetical protein RRG08_054469 [Elysia crispata]